MNKRSALFVAAGLVVSMLVAGTAILMGVTGPSSAHADVAVPPRHKQKAVVKTVKRTVTVHEPALAPSTSSGLTLATGPTSTGPNDANDDDGSRSEGAAGHSSTTSTPSPTSGSGGWGDGGDDGGTPSGSGSPSPGWGGDD